MVNGTSRSLAIVFARSVFPVPVEFNKYDVGFLHIHIIVRSGVDALVMVIDSYREIFFASSCPMIY